MSEPCDHGDDRSAIYPGDSLAAFYTRGWFAGYARLPIAVCGYPRGPVRNAWVYGYAAGMRMSTRTSLEHRARHR